MTDDERSELAKSKLHGMSARLAADMLPLSHDERLELAVRVGGLVARQLFDAGYDSAVVAPIVSELLEGAEAMLAALEQDAGTMGQA